VASVMVAETVTWCRATPARRRAGVMSRGLREQVVGGGVLLGHEQQAVKVPLLEADLPGVGTTARRGLLGSWQTGSPAGWTAY
jgi:hypothetical protein